MIIIMLLLPVFNHQVQALQQHVHRGAICCLWRPATVCSTHTHACRHIHVIHGWHVSDGHISMISGLLSSTPGSP
jgi:hypothetical protein